ncbi:Trm112 family protein [Candidatus Mesenet endosymbiont of Agriotes lineatus]|uniref:Trm112 family protein n=1 Tax=Candidatus Mesenet endosymbiont of Agriotes lineatus TaxID=3077948 RepID=UPI0030D37D65
MFDETLLDVLVCPLTKTALRYDVNSNELISDEAGLAFPIRDDIPIMLIDEARKI